MYAVFTFAYLCISCRAYCFFFVFFFKLRETCLSYARECWTHVEETCARSEKVEKLARCGLINQPRLWFYTHDRCVNFCTQSERIATRVHVYTREKKDANKWPEIQNLYYHSYLCILHEKLFSFSFVKNSGVRAYLLVLIPVLIETR